MARNSSGDEGGSDLISFVYVSLLEDQLWFPAVFLDHCSPCSALVLCGVGLCSACEVLKDSLASATSLHEM